MKVEETVFESLTQQYEIAKVQEAKEFPSVKVLDPAEIPEKKVFPPRILLIVIGTMSALGIAIASLSFTDKWKNIDPQDPGKQLVLNMVQSVKPQLEYVTRQKATVFARAKKFFERAPGEAVPAETE
jgi:hypothetical protein